MTTPVAETDAVSTNSLDADNRTARRMAVGFLRARWLRNLRVCLLTAAAAWLGARGVDHQAPVWISIPFLPLLLWSMWRGTIRQMRVIAPAGSTLITEFREETLVIRTEVASSESRLDSITQIAANDLVAVFRHGNRRIVNVLPRGIFPDHEVERIRALLLRGQEKRPDSPDLGC